MVDREKEDAKQKQKKAPARRRRQAPKEEEGSDWALREEKQKKKEAKCKGPPGIEDKDYKPGTNIPDDGFDWRAKEMARKELLKNERNRSGYKKGFKLDGTKRVGRLLLDDALKSKTSMEGWSEARKKAFKEIEKNPNSYYYRFNKPGEPQANGGIQADEHKVFMEILK